MKPKRPLCSRCRRQRRPALYVDERPVCGPCLTDAELAMTDQVRQTTDPVRPLDPHAHALARVLFDRARDGARD